MQFKMLESKIHEHNEERCIFQAEQECSGEEHQ